MEQLDVVYVILKRELRNVVGSDGKEVIVDYVYDHKVVDIGEAHWVVMYGVSESAEFLSLGATSYGKKWTVAVDVRTDSKEVYGLIKEKVFKAFTRDENKAKVFVEKDAYDAVLDVDVIERKGVYLLVVQLQDVSGLAVGMYVKVRVAGLEYNGWIVDITGNSVLVFTKRGTFVLMKPSVVRDLSDRMKGLFRCVIEIEGMSLIW